MITWHVQYCSCETERFVYRFAIFFLTETKLGDLLSWLRSILLMWHFFSFFILGTGMLQKVCIIDITSWSFYLLCHTKHITDQSHLISTLSIDGAIVVFVSVHTRNSLTVTQPPLPPSLHILQLLSWVSQAAIWSILGGMWCTPCRIDICLL